MRRNLILPLLGGLFLFLAVPSFAGIGVKEEPINRAGVGVTVSVSTSAWTVGNNSTSKIEQRAGYKVNNPAGNSAAVFYTCQASAPSQAITVGDGEIGAGENPFIPCGQNLNIYFRSLHTAAESIHLKEYGQ